MRLVSCAKNENMDKKQNSVRLAAFNGSNFDKGAGFLKITLWYFVNALLVRASWNPFMGIKIVLLRMLRQILGVSIWIMIQHGIAFLGWFVFFVVMEHQGERPLAITNVVRSISSFLFMFVNAFASTSSSLVSNLIGAGKPEQVMGLCGRMIRICYYFVLPLGILIALFPELVLRIYTDNLDLIAGSVSSLWVMLSSYLIVVPAFIFFFSVSGTGNTQTALLIDMASIFVYVLYALWVGIRMHADVAVCWTTEHVYDLMILSAFFYLWKGNWQNKKL